MQVTTFEDGDITDKITTTCIEHVQLSTSTLFYHAPLALLTPHSYLLVLFFEPWRWRQYVLPIFWWICTELFGATSQNITTFHIHRCENPMSSSWQRISSGPANGSANIFCLSGKQLIKYLLRDYSCSKLTATEGGCQRFCQALSAMCTDNREWICIVTRTLVKKGFALTSVVLFTWSRVARSV
jgi:hypothetical protein